MNQLNVARVDLCGAGGGVLLVPMLTLITGFTPIQVVGTVRLEQCGAAIAAASIASVQPQRLTNQAVVRRHSPLLQTVALSNVTIPPELGRPHQPGVQPAAQNPHLSGPLIDFDLLLLVRDGRSSWDWEGCHH